MAKKNRGRRKKGKGGAGGEANNTEVAAVQVTSEDGGAIVEVAAADEGVEVVDVKLDKKDDLEKTVVAALDLVGEQSGSQDGADNDNGKKTNVDGGSNGDNKLQQGGAANGGGGEEGVEVAAPTKKKRKRRPRKKKKKPAEGAVDDTSNAAGSTIETSESTEASPTKAAPSEEVSTKGAPDEKPSEEVPSEEAAKEVPACPAVEEPVKESPTEEAPLADAPVDGTRVEETPTVDSPAQATPSEQTPAEEPHAEDNPPVEEETPTEVVAADRGVPTITATEAVEEVVNAAVDEPVSEEVPVLDEAEPADAAIDKATDRGVATTATTEAVEEVVNAAVDEPVAGEVPVLDDAEPANTTVEDSEDVSNKIGDDAAEGLPVVEATNSSIEVVEEVKEAAPTGAEESPEAESQVVVEEKKTDVHEEPAVKKESKDDAPKCPYGFDGGGGKGASSAAPSMPRKLDMLADKGKTLDLSKPSPGEASSAKNDCGCIIL